MYPPDDVDAARELGRREARQGRKRINPYTLYAVWEVLPEARIEVLAAAWDEGYTSYAEPDVANAARPPKAHS